MQEACIFDARLLNDFKGVTFNNIKLTEVKKEYIKCIIDSNYDKSIYWMCEILTSCHYLVLWESYFYILCNVIYDSNIKLFKFVYNKYVSFKDYITQCSSEDSIMNLRNNKNIQSIFTDITVLMCMSKKNIVFDYKKANIAKVTFDNLYLHLKAPNVHYVNNYFRDNDPKELFILLNEYVYNIEAKNINECFKWIHIYINYITKCKSNKNVIKCDVREELGLNNFPDSLQRHPIWIIWAIINNMVKDKENASIYINLLLDFFKVHLTVGKIKGRLNLLCMATMIFINCENKKMFESPIVYDKSEFIKLDNIARNSLKSIYDKIISHYRKNNKDNPETKRTKQNKVDMSFEKLKVLDNFMINKNNDTN